MQWQGSIGLVRFGHSCHPDSQKKAPMKEPFLVFGAGDED